MFLVRPPQLPSAPRARASAYFAHVLGLVLLARRRRVRRTLKDTRIPAARRVMPVYVTCRRGPRSGRPPRPPRAGAAASPRPPRAAAAGPLVRDSCSAKTNLYEINDLSCTRWKMTHLPWNILVELRHAAGEAPAGFDLHGMGAGRPPRAGSQTLAFLRAAAN